MEPDMTTPFLENWNSGRIDSSYYSPERLTLLKRIFDNTCTNSCIPDGEMRDYLASELLVAGQSYMDEDKLILFMNTTIGRLRH
jgi:hypothetical protein